MRYAEFLERPDFSKQQILAFAHGNLIEDMPEGHGGISQLPAPPFLMFDRITKIERKNRGGTIVAEQDIHSDAWFFMCHFRNDPVQPGCLGVDAIWQLLGFYCAASGAQGAGRALGCGEVEFFGQIRPFDKVVRYELDVRRYSVLEKSGSAMGIADGRVYVDDVLVYRVSKAKAGIFKDIAYTDFPNPDSKYARGGLLNHD